MGCNSSKDPLLADIYSAYEQKYDFEQILAPPSQTDDNSPLLETEINDNVAIIRDDEIDINNNSSNLSQDSGAYDILIDLNDKMSKLIIRLSRYNGSALAPIIKLGLNKSKHSPQRTRRYNTNTKTQQHGLLTMELIISHFIHNSNVNVYKLCVQRFFPNDIKAMIISFYSVSHPQLQTFRVLISTAILCKSILNLCNYIGVMLSTKLLFQHFIKKLNINDTNEINQQLIISKENASICRQLIFLFHYILCLDQYKMPKQQPLTNNFTAYKRMYSQFANQQNYSSYYKKSNDSNRSDKNNDNNNLTSKELLDAEHVTNISMFMGRGSTACIDTICESITSDNDLMEISILSQFANGCLTLLRANGNNKAVNNRNINIVKYALYILRAMVAILLILDNKKTEISQFNSVFSNNENRVKIVDCCKMICTQFMQYYGDDQSIETMQGIGNRNDIICHIKYCKRIIKFGAKGFKTGQIKRSLQNMFD